MDHSTVARARSGANSRFPLQQNHLRPFKRKVSCYSDTDHPSADHQKLGSYASV
jgi:hypothetical protein